MRPRFFRDDTGSALVETLFVIPILVLLTFGIVQMGLTFWIFATMNHVARDVSREISVGEMDDETNGVLTACRSLSGTSPGGGLSAEKAACDLMGILPGDFFVLASDGDASQLASSGSFVRVQLEVDTASISPIDVFGIVTSTNRLTAVANLVVE